MGTFCLAESIREKEKAIDRTLDNDWLGVDVARVRALLIRVGELSFHPLVVKLDLHLLLIYVLGNINLRRLFDLLNDCSFAAHNRTLCLRADHLLNRLLAVVNLAHNLIHVLLPPLSEWL